MKRTIAALAMGTAFAANALAAHAAVPMVGGAPMYPTRNIVENAVNSKDHTTLVAAVRAAGLVETLQGAGPFTVFAPTDAAFAKLPVGTVETLLKPENRAQLAKVLSCHVAAARATSADAMKMIDDDGGRHAIATVGGCTITASVEDGNLVLTDENGGIATVTIADVAQSNGVVHVIDAVLLPKQ
jgi:uncharacterized surface protein with fasciclin (FAS1) repeats